MTEESARSRIRRAADKSPWQDADHRSQQRNAGVAIAVLAVVVIGLLIAMVSGAMLHA